MKNFCGWYARTPLRGDARHVLEGIADHHDIPKDDRHMLSGGNYGLLGQDLSSAGAGTPDLLALLSGAPRWSSDGPFASTPGNADANSLVDAYRQFGVEVLTGLVGSFAVAILDLRKNVVILAVDRFGIHRLCYTLGNDGSLVFASSADHLLRFPSVQPSLSSQGIYDYFYFHMIPSPSSIYKDVYKIEPGRYVVFEGGECRTGEYWKPTAQNRSASAKELAGQLKDSLGHAVGRSLSASGGAPTGAFLSGGLDSSTVCGMLAESSDRTVQAYSIGFDQPGFDEMHYARVAAKHFGLSLHEYYVTPDDVARSIPEIAAAYDEPFGNSSAVPALFCARMAKAHGIEVMLAGDGGDELFAGNARYARQKLFSLYFRLPESLRRVLIEPLFLRTFFGNIPTLPRKIRSYIEQASVPMPMRLETYNFLYRTDPERVFSERFLGSVAVGGPSRHLQNIWDSMPDQSLLDRMLFLDWKMTLADNDLRKVNRMCELAGVAVDYPMLDHDLVSLSLRIPDEMKLKRLELRHFFKSSLRDFLPKAVIKKTKHGFGLPFGEWLVKSPKLREVVFDSLGDLKKRDIVSDEYIERLIADHSGNHPGYFGEMLWLLVMFEQWLQHHEMSRV